VSIVHGIIDGSAAGARPAPVVAVGVALALHAALWGLVASTQPSPEPWRAPRATHVQVELRRQSDPELPPPPTVQHREPVATHVPPSLAVPGPPAPRAAPWPAPVRAERPAAGTSPPTAPAGQIVAQEPEGSDTLDLTALTFVTGTASVYGGGASTRDGSSLGAMPARAPGHHASFTTTPRAADHSRPVQLNADDWQCAWPREADDEWIDEQFVVLRVVVGRDGRVTSASLVADPGHGFGAAALACVMRTRFIPARDARGALVETSSPPIRVRFTR
jgi:periplasmic protein TonB